jgi:hypothetical protein
MSDRAKQIVESMTRLLEKARELTAEHKKIMQEFNLLQDELDRINLDETERLKRIIN